MVAAIEVGFAFIYQASTYRTCSNAFSGLKSSCFFFGNRIASIQHHGQHVFDPGHKLFRCPGSIKEAVVRPWIFLQNTGECMRIELKDENQELKTKLEEILTNQKVEGGERH